MSIRVLLVGYGSVGFVFSYLLQSIAKVDLTVVARSNFQSAFDGKIELQSMKYGKVQGFRPKRVHASVADAADQAYDYVIVTTKAFPELNPTSKLLAPLLAASYTHPQPTYILIQNGVGVEKDLYAALQSRADATSTRVISCAVYILANTVGNVVDHRILSTAYHSKIEAGVYRPLGVSAPTVTADADSEALNTFISICSECNIEALVAPDIHLAKFRKNMWNLCFGIMGCLTRASHVAFWASPSVIEKMEPIMLAVSKEAIAVGTALGYDPTGLEESRLQLLAYAEGTVIKGSTDGHKSSMLMDIEAGKPFELEVILGEVVRNGKRLGVPIPLLEAYYAMLYVIQNQIAQKAGRDAA